ncbi:MAG TPA: nucleoside triphosphate pyrophosphohydrolase family protein [Candidatus Saccharimonadales bacterium]
MKIDEYTKIALSTLGDGQDFGDLSPQLVDQILGLVGESGEIAEKFKKIIRDKKGVLSKEDKVEIIKELGDVLWYITTIAHLLDSDLETVAKRNNEKLLSRKARGKISGSGDNR